MNLKSISFQGYKAFSENQEIELKPLTLLIGKNSSGKSAIAKLTTLIEASLSKAIDVPLMLVNNTVELGNEFIDLVFDKYPSTPITLSINFKDGRILSVEIIQPVNEYIPIIYSWTLIDEGNEFHIFYDDGEKNGVYKDKNGGLYKCVFKGFIPNSIKRIDDDEEIVGQLNIEKLEVIVDYIGPFRTLPPRVFSLIGQPYLRKMGVKGEQAYSILGYDKLMNGSLIKEASAWFTKNFDNWSIDILESKYPLLELVLYKQSKEKVQVNIADVGQGMSQALPLVVRALMKTEPTLITLEQPELHLHPAAHADLVELFASSALRYKHTFLIETHSENFILRLRKLIVEKESALTSEDVVIYFIEDDEKEGQRARKIEIDDEGNLSDWPTGVFNENLEEVIAIKKALKERKISNDSKN